MRELALENPAATRVFEKLGIDYCCGGKSPSRKLAAARIWNRTGAGCPGRRPSRRRVPESGTELARERSADLIAHITNKHHSTREKRSPASARSSKRFPPSTGRTIPSFRDSQTFPGLAQELTTHLMKEEMVLFPYIVRMEEASSRKNPSAAALRQRENPISMMDA